MLTDVLAKSGEAAKSGPIGLAVILILCIVCYFLFKSMSKHLRTVRENPPADAPQGPSVQASTAVEQKPTVEQKASTKPPARRPAGEDGKPNPDGQPGAYSAAE
jgi:hypothetical protein